MQIVPLATVSFWAKSASSRCRWLVRSGSGLAPRGPAWRHAMRLGLALSDANLQLGCVAMRSTPADKNENIRRAALAGQSTPKVRAGSFFWTRLCTAYDYVTYLDLT